jgi:hypothetical protein
MLGEMHGDRAATKTIQAAIDANVAMGAYRPRLDPLAAAHAQNVARFVAGRALEALEGTTNEPNAAYESADNDRTLAAGALRVLFESEAKGHLPLWSLLVEAYGTLDWDTSNVVRNVLGAVDDGDPLPRDPESAGPRIRALFARSPEDLAARARAEYIKRFHHEPAPLQAERSE